MSGYDQFFKQAQKNSGLLKNASKTKAAPRKAAKSAGPRDEIRLSKNRFPLKPGETPEDRLRQELALRMRQKKANAISRKKKFPAFTVGCVVAALISCAVGYYKSDALDEMVEHVTSHVEIGFLGQAQAEAAKPAPKAEAKPVAKQEKPAAKSAETKEPAATSEVAPPKGWTAEEMSFFSKLNDRKKELDAREADLAKLEEELQKRKTELDEKLKQLEATREEISKALKSRVTSDQQKVAKLVEFYSNMKPQQAAKVIESLNEDLAVEILDSMKKKNAAEVLNVMDAKKARKLSELLTGYQRTTASVGSGSESPAEEKPAQ